MKRDPFDDTYNREAREEQNRYRNLYGETRKSSKIKLDKICETDVSEEKIDEMDNFEPFFKGYKPQYYFKKPQCTCALLYFQARKCPVHKSLSERVFENLGIDVSKTK